MTTSFSYTLDGAGTSLSSYKQIRFWKAWNFYATAMMNHRKSIDKIALGKSDALLVIDVQNDFLPGGSLAVPEGDQVIPVLNGYIEQFIKRRLPVFATRDWHPSHHSSFIPQGGPWPEHCIANSKGAEFASGLHLPAFTYIISKGTEVDLDGYSGFANRTLKDQLDNAGACRLFIGGLATDYCVLNTVRDALSHHYEVMLLTDAMRAVNVRRQDGENAINEMIQQGAIPITLIRLS
jgi:nicotinamidase/pyrazinamidase